MNNCSVHTFHDNLVSHESEISAMDNAYEFNGVCWEYLTDYIMREKYLSITNFIRPEDVFLYEQYFDAVKIATRVNISPIRVLKAYINGKYSGSIMDLLEPNHSGLLYPYIIENNKITNEYGSKVLNCSKECNKCGYCRDVYKNALVKLEESLC